MDFRSALVSLAPLLALVSCSTPSVPKYLASHREELTADIERVRAVEAELPKAPTDDVPFVGVDSGATAIVAVEDFVWLKTAPVAGRLARAPTVAGRPSLHGDLDYVAASLRTPSIPQSARHEIETLERMRADLPKLKFVGVVTTTDWRPATEATSADWRGRVAVWDLTARRWLGGVPVRVLEAPYTKTGAYWTGGGMPDHSADSTPEERSSRLQLNLAVSRAVAAGTPYEVVQSQKGTLDPMPPPRAPMFPRATPKPLTPRKAK